MLCILPYSSSVYASYCSKTYKNHPVAEAAFFRFPAHAIWEISGKPRTLPDLSTSVSRSPGIFRPISRNYTKFPSLHKRDSVAGDVGKTGGRKLSKRGEQVFHILLRSGVENRAVHFPTTEILREIQGISSFAHTTHNSPTASPQPVIHFPQPVENQCGKLWITPK